MKTTTLFLILLLAGSILFAQVDQAQGVSGDKKMTQEEKKTEKEKKAGWMKEVTRQMVETRRFVLEADYLKDRIGQSIPVTPSLNFIIIDSSEAVIQVGSGIELGFNGVGGVTIEGQVTKYEFNRTEKKKYTAYNIAIVVFSNVGIYDINMFVTDSGKADATIRNQSSGSISYSGILYPPGISKIYKGASWY